MTMPLAADGSPNRIDDASRAQIDVVDDNERAERIRVAVRARGAEMRRRHPVLQHQSGIGAGILTIATLGVIAVALAYAGHLIPWWVALPVAAMFMSLSHEIEHDVIHRLYYPRNSVAQDVMLAVGWLLRPYTVSPWVRRPIHLLHHEASGTERDLEEVLIGNGLRWSPLRALVMIDPLATVVFHLARRDGRQDLVRVAIETFDPVIAQVRALPRRWQRAVATLKLAFPLTGLALAVWYSFLALSTIRLLDLSSGPAGPFSQVVNFLTVVWVGPNLLRVACLHGISSNMHYFGDVEDGNVIQQTQVLNRWWLLPAQLFCFDFGSTHGIHHFVPGDPFYLRHITRREAHRVMRANGVRFNDLGTFRRANRRSAVEGRTKLVSGNPAI